MKRKKNKIRIKVMLCPYCKTKKEVRARSYSYKVYDLKIKKTWALCPNCHQIFEEEERLWY